MTDLTYLGCHPPPVATYLGRIGGITRCVGVRTLCYSIVTYTKHVIDLAVQCHTHHHTVTYFDFNLRVAAEGSRASMLSPLTSPVTWTGSSIVRSFLRQSYCSSRSFSFTSYPRFPRISETHVGGSPPNPSFREQVARANGVKSFSQEVRHPSIRNQVFVSWNHTLSLCHF